MSFLTPLYLLAGLAILAPVLAHLVRKRPREVMDFSSVIFMDPASPRLTNRNRIDQWLLLALRSLILLSLALAFARPYLKSLVQKETTGKPSRERILLIDTSASMRREGVWDQAVQKAKDYISKCDPEDTIAVYTLTDKIEALQSLDQARRGIVFQRQSLANKSIEGLGPTWYSSDLGKGMAQALELFKDEEREGDSPTLAEIAVVSDFQQGSSLEALGSTQWPANIPVIPLVCNPKSSGNASISILPRATEGEQEVETDYERVLVRNSSKSRFDKFSLRWLNSEGQPVSNESIEVFVPAGQQQIVRMARPQEKAITANENSNATRRIADPSVPLMIELEGDQQPFDNRQYLYRGEKQFAQALCIDSNKGPSSESLWYFVKLVLFTQSGLEVVWQVKDPSDAFEEDPQGDRRWVVASSQLERQWAEGLRPAIEKGLHLLWVLDKPAQGLGLQGAANDTSNNATANNTTSSSDTALVESHDYSVFEKVMGEWFPDESLKISEADTKRFYMLQQIDMLHPVFAPFADPKYNDFTKICFWKHRRIEGLENNHWRVLAKFDDGYPAIMQRPLGKGMVSVLASGWQPSESQLALSSKFVPMMATMFEQANPPKPVLDYRCGDPIPESIANLRWKSSTGQELLAGATTATGRLEAPGLYRAVLTGETTPEPSVSAAPRTQEPFVAVNIPKGESLTDPIELEEFARFGIPIDNRNAIDLDRERTLQNHQLAEQLEANQGGWWWILLAVLLFAGLESVVAALRSRSDAAQAAN